MFSKKEKELKQRISELELTCSQLEELVDACKEACDSKDFKISELEYRLKLNEQDIKALNNVISNLMSEKNKLTAKKIRKTRKIEVATVGDGETTSK